MKKIFLILFILSMGSVLLFSQEKITVKAGGDLVSRYVWRGLDFGNAPNLQPSLSASYSGFTLGIWGSYSLSNNVSAGDEIDTYLSYNYSFENSAALSLIITDYYFPNAGKKMGNFRNYDDVDGSGAHTLEAGVAFTGSEKFPFTLSAYYNFYNDAGNNTYFEFAYPVQVSDISLTLFAGATAGGKENPGYYGADNFSFINTGIKASKVVKISESFSLPVFVQYSINPKLEKSYLVFGISL